MCISHYELTKYELEEQINDSKQKLKEICSARRYDVLINKAQQLRNRRKKKLEKTKKKKINKLLSMRDLTPVDTNENLWITSLNLNQNHKQIIITNLFH